MISFPLSRSCLFLWQESYFLMLIFINGCPTEMVSSYLNQPGLQLASETGCVWSYELGLFGWLVLLFCTFFFFIFLDGIMCLGLLFVDGKHPGCDQSYMGRREFSFTLDNDIYLRFQSFNSASELENSIKEKCPVKIDIGPVYSVDVSFIFSYPHSIDSELRIFNNYSLVL